MRFDESIVSFTIKLLSDNPQIYNLMYIMYVSRYERDVVEISQ